jgi:probable HAF family extracellular repeat protein
MMRNAFRVVLAATAALLAALLLMTTSEPLSAAKPPPAPKYSITFLGTLSGSWSSASSINGNGDVVGLSAVDTAVNSPFVHTAAGGMRDLNRVIPNTGLDRPVEVIRGVDGNLYVSSAFTDEVRRYDGTTGEALGAFVSSGSGGLDNPSGLAFGPDGLYVVSRWSHQVLKYDGTTGASSVFVSAGSGGLYDPVGLVFGPDHNDDEIRDLYVVSGAPVDQVLVYSGPGAANAGEFLGSLFPTTTMLVGAFGLALVESETEKALYITGSNGGGAGPESLGNVVRWDFEPDPMEPQLTEFVAKGSGGLLGPRRLAWGPDGKLYVASGHLNNVLRYNSDGTFDKAFLTSGSGGLNCAVGILFHSGNLVVTSRDSDQLLVYEGPGGANPGALIGSFVPGTGWLLTSALDINDAGQIVGEASFLGQPTRGYRLTPQPAGTPWTLEIIEPPAGGQTTHAVGINGAGDVTGHIHYASSDRAFIWNPSIGTMQLPAFGSFSSIKGKGINNNLQVAASAGPTGPRALRWDAASAAWKNLGVLSGGSASGASDINGSGQVSGFSSTSTSPSRAVRYSDGSGLKNLGTLGGGSSSQSDATGINSVGEVVGWSQISGGGTRLFLYRDSGGMINLENTIVNLPSGLLGRLSPGKISDTGKICGTADDGTLEAFVLTPQ